MNTQVGCWNSLVRLAGWVNCELVGSMRNTERMIFNSVHNIEMSSEMCYIQFISSRCQNRRMAECSLPESQELWLEIPVARIAESRDRRMFGNINSFSGQSNLPFCGARWKTRGRCPGVRGTGSRGMGSRGVENTGSGGKHGVSVENTGSKWKTRGNHYFAQQWSRNFVISNWNENQ